MPKKPLKVLSIDFDYFQKVSADTLSSCYPDGKDNPTFLTKITWVNHYACSEEQLKKVTLLEKPFGQICELLLRHKFNTPCMAVNSHIHIYDFIKDHYSDKYDGCYIVNIDTHHDLFNSSSKLDCGNWGTHIKKLIPKTQITWIANPVSKEMYGIEENTELSKIIETDFSKILGKTFDIIFLCRSDTWLPPHLDKYFDELYTILTTNFASCIIDKQITKPRFTDDELQEAIEEYRNVASSMDTLRELNSKANKGD